VIALQLTIAALMVLNFLPPTLRGLHAAIGSLLWIVLVALAWNALKKEGSFQDARIKSR